ncbi:hypothetical protein [Actinoplanes xinjiangensis]|uniref:Ricin-type beta-trefoil lectin protein n=1 Tax=Actinoplanes xinjiangensis TaxID=512350 RepID=A0A316FY40_9ACTN|nr:hypothetical protein [Actinoplanes xinjiangensis]PWK46997.1 hypothetical protein BC793_108111 [Actinoplanes xinjiangensis]GIF40156.1 hypothetical protein Axi01nite_44670 [Actinoplanes xinjiangensis]
MSDDRLQQGLDSYAELLQHTAGLAPAAEIRRRGDRRRRNRAAGAAFAAVLITAAGLGTAFTRGGESGPPLPPAASPTPSASVPRPSAAPSRTRTVTSDVSRLRELGVDLDTGVLIDVADDAVDRWMAVGPGDVVDFTGAARDASTGMSLVPAPVTARDRVIIVPVARPGWCVTDTSGVPLALQPCRDGDPTQTWEVVPAGDSGQINLRGPDGDLRVGDDGLVPPDESGRSGLQTIPFDR